jgi:23S rRNA (pseudouridine1915-N3)-methyltransferase
LRVTIIAVGRLRAGPEADMVADYLARFDRAGRALGIGPARVLEVEDRRGGRSSAEADLLRAAVPRDARVIALDERGARPSSQEFAADLRREADEGIRDLAFLIGGADGLDPSLRSQAAACLSFGPMVWPHMLVRVMLSEQLYRAATILAGGPYHRG